LLKWSYYNLGYDNTHNIADVVVRGKTLIADIKEMENAIGSIVKPTIKATFNGTEGNIGLSYSLHNYFIPSEVELIGLDRNSFSGEAPLGKSGVYSLFINSEKRKAFNMGTNLMLTRSPAVTSGED
jgi:hypothetical protein